MLAYLKYYLTILYMVKYKKRYRKRGSKLKKQVYRNAAKLKRLRGAIERKAYQVAQVENVNCNTTGLVIHLTPMADGDTVVNRTGQEVYLKNLMIRLHLKNSHGTPEDCLVRIIVFRAYDAHAALPSLGGGAQSLLEQIGIINSVNRWDSNDDFKVYYDNTIAMDTSLHSNIPLKIRLSKLNCRTTWDSNLGDIGHAQRNHLFLAFFSTVAGTTNDPLIDYVYRVTYDDA